MYMYMSISLVPTTDQARHPVSGCVESTRAKPRSEYGERENAISCRLEIKMELEICSTGRIYSELHIHTHILYMYMYVFKC